MQIAIVFDSHTGKTAATATAMRKVLEGSGHHCTLQSMSSADPEAVLQADLVLLGCPTWGLFLVLQHPTKEWLGWVERLPGDLTGKRVALFTSYLIRTGPVLRKMKRPLESRGARVEATFWSKGGALPRGFEDWVATI